MSNNVECCGKYYVTHIFAQPQNHTQRRCWQKIHWIIRIGSIGSISHYLCKMSMQLKCMKLMLLLVGELNKWYIDIVYFVLLIERWNILCFRYNWYSFSVITSQIGGHSSFIQVGPSSISLSSQIHNVPPFRLCES